VFVIQIIEINKFMKQYRIANLAGGWFVFLFALVVFLLTMEPTASWWDCSERIIAASKLQIAHPPGAPFFMILGRFFTLFAADAGKIAVMMNTMSVLLSSFTVMLLFWVITSLAKKLVTTGEEITIGQTFAIIGSGLVGSVAFTFSDSFWFIAVEAEAYATSVFFTALVFWSILRWEKVADQPHSTRWLILIAYLMGLSIGVHLLNLLAIPAIVFVYYFKKYPVTRNGIIYAALIAMALLGSFVYVIIPGVISLASYFELLFVNSFGLPYNTGVLFFVVAMIAAIVWLVRFSHSKKLIVLNHLILGLTVILIGYSSYAVVIIRAGAGPPMNQASPDDVFSLLSYLNREQYGERPLVHGQYYSAPSENSEEGRPYYIQENGRYVISGYRPKSVYAAEFTGLFPRMYSNSESHIREYQRWGRVKGNRIRYTNPSGESEVLIKPTFVENLRFFINYQIGHMYFRYFMWNFVGRQNDIQGHGEVINGNWLTGINAVDEFRLGPQDLPESLQSKARNTYFALPFLFGLMGMFFQLRNRPKDFSVVMMLFFFTGIAIVIYLNQTPLQPRERDYSYAGSFFAFSIWVGLGVLALVKGLEKVLSQPVSALIATVVGLFLVPAIMAKENWDDHDRSGRYTVRDFAANYLNTCEPNAILFTYGDNDTFPLWYAQEVEGVRRDVRIVNTMLLNTDWYIDQMQTKMHDSEPLPVSIPRRKYLEGTNPAFYIFDRVDDFIDVRRIMNFVADDNPQTKAPVQRGVSIDYIPTKKFRLPVDKQKVISNGTVHESLTDEIVPSIDWEWTGPYVVKNQMIALDIIANFDWNRPVYFVSGGTEDALGLEPFFQLEGFAYRLVPVKTESDDFLDYGRVNTDALYENLMNKFSWGRINEPDFHMDHYNHRTLKVLQLRNKFVRLANALTEEGKKDSAIKALDRCMELMPIEKVPYDFFMIGVADAYYKADGTEQAVFLLKEYFNVSEKEFNYYSGFPSRFSGSVEREIRIPLQIMNELILTADSWGETELMEELSTRFDIAYNSFNRPMF
jgi:hypothetical protein